MSHLLCSRGALLTFKPPQYLCLGVLFPKRKGSGGLLLHVSWQCSTWLRGYQVPSISLWSEHGPLLPEGNPPNQSADSLRRCYGEREERKGCRKVEGKGWGEGWIGRDYRKWQCSWNDKPLARTPTPWGRTGGYKTSASVLSPWWPCLAISLPSFLLIVSD